MATDHSPIGAAVAQLQAMLRVGRERVNQPLPLHSHGTLTRLTGLVLEARGCACPWARSAIFRCLAQILCWPRWWVLPATVPF